MNTLKELDIFTKLFLVIIFLTLFVRVCYVYLHDHILNPNYSETSIEHREENNKNIVKGLPSCVINSYGTFAFEKNNIANINNDYDTNCSICIVDYKESEILRMMPQCRHYFHKDCVDTWLKIKGSCPICRNSLLQASSNDVSNLESV